LNHVLRKLVQTEDGLAHQFGFGASVNGTIWKDVRRRAPLYVGFIATGVALTIPGAILPLLLLRWSMNDAHGGLLLFSFYGVGSFGSYCARGRMNRSVARGAVLTLLGAVCLGWAGRWTAYGAIALYGLGLSLTMTSISLLLSQRFPEQRRLELTRLNLVWAIGAALGPWIALRSTRGASVTQASALLHAQHVLLGVAIFFAFAAAWAMGMEESPATAAARTRVPAASKPGEGNRFGVPWPLLLLIFGATGVDAAAGGWLTSYAQRAGDSLGITIGAATFLWVGALLSRIAHSTRWASRLPERAVLGSSMLAMTAALALLIAWPAGLVTMLAALLLGLAAGPVYPLVVAAALRHRENSTVFAIAGVGASVLPLATGTLSTGTHSLRAGLGVPLFAAVVMVVLVAVSRSAFEGKGATVTEVLIG
jgi:MFS transporter, FHS family, glucose/mannose:H+ symporter